MWWAVVYAQVLLSPPPQPEMSSQPMFLNLMEKLWISLKVTQCFTRSPNAAKHVSANLWNSGLHKVGDKGIRDLTCTRTHINFLIKKQHDNFLRFNLRRTLTQSFGSANHQRHLEWSEAGQNGRESQTAQYLTHTQEAQNLASKFASYTKPWPRKS